jgi:hypothetical protein
VNVHIGADRKVRAADVEYKVLRESKFCVMTRPIHKLVLAVPVEEQTMEKEAEVQGSQEDDGVNEEVGEGTDEHGGDGLRDPGLPVSPDPAGKKIQKKKSQKNQMRMTVETKR